MSINMMINATLHDLILIDQIKAGEPMDHQDAYDSYEVRVDLHEDPRVWFSEMRA